MNDRLGPRLIVTAEARELRRVLGPGSWVVLEDVALDARLDEHGHLVAATNVRRVAANVGVSKDTAARALTRLVALGVVSRTGVGRDRSGTYAPTGYLLHADRLGGLELDGRAGEVPAGSGRADGQPPEGDRVTDRSVADPRGGAAQVSLFDPAVGVAP